MSHRDDLDAALARNDALARELADVRAELLRVTPKSKLRSERDRLARRVEELEQQLGQGAAPSAAPSRPKPSLHERNVARAPVGLTGNSTIMCPRCLSGDGVTMTMTKTFVTTSDFRSALCTRCGYAGWIRE